jgi:hypothetical protein
MGKKRSPCILPQKERSVTVLRLATAVHTAHDPPGCRTWGRVALQLRVHVSADQRGAASRIASLLLAFCLVTRPPARGTRRWGVCLRAHCGTCHLAATMQVRGAPLPSLDRSCSNLRDELPCGGTLVAMAIPSRPTRSAPVRYPMHRALLRRGFTLRSRPARVRMVPAALRFAVPPVVSIPEGASWIRAADAPFRKSSSFRAPRSSLHA